MQTCQPQIITRTNSHDIYSVFTGLVIEIAPLRSSSAWLPFSPIIFSLRVLLVPTGTMADHSASVIHTSSLSGNKGEEWLFSSWTTKHARARIHAPFLWIAWYLRKTTYDVTWTIVITRTTRQVWSKTTFETADVFFTMARCPLRFY